MPKTNPQPTTQPGQARSRAFKPAAAAITAAIIAAFLAAIIAAMLAAAPAARAQAPSGPPGEDQLTAPIVASEPRLTERDIDLFIELFTQIFAVGSDRVDPAAFARSRGVTMIRLNLVAAKAGFLRARKEVRESMVNELGLRMLWTPEELAALEPRRSQVEAILAVFAE
jgi:hypothetical protein